ncbi:hypothetical protein [Actinopolyspora mortivallis]|uniref:Uncharacterized protein n=1 Tax=Actinopolyspora mortivallis TaxID=33906 RepID=A0A2T0GSA0_ACTMO|nr:hypothetical protein [Actinopolyspora mortivallis]PRW61974.1 hypothetical protein CEP50_17955 [Actinopolyspora mortivallis]
MIPVRGYTRRDGTRVRPHTRSAPSSGGGPPVPLGLLVVGALSLGALALGGSAFEDSPEDAGRRTWQHGGLTFTTVDSDSSSSCADHAYGRVAEFFAEHPCEKLRRTLLTVSDGGGGTVVVAVSRTTMPTVESAVELRELVDTQGTGNLDELSRDSLTHSGVEFDGRHYASTRRETTVTVSEAAPRSARAEPSRNTLEKAARTALLHPGP